MLLPKVQINAALIAVIHLVDPVRRSGVQADPIYFPPLPVNHTTALKQIHSLVVAPTTDECTNQTCESERPRCVSQGADHLSYFG